MGVSIIAAVSMNGAIGRNNDLLWHLSADLKFFKATTMGHPVIMGRRTFESIGRPLPGRRNIVISHSESQLPEGVELAHSLNSALEMLGEDAQPFVIGGGQIYAQAMDIADTLYITRVFASVDDADTFFPPILADEWDIEEQGDTLIDEKSGIGFRFEKYTRR